MIAALVVFLLLTAAVTNIGPELAAWAISGSIKAWEYVAQGAQSSALWVAVLALLLPYGRVRVPAIAVCTYGATEAALRPICRLAFPMDRAPSVPAPDGLCSAAGWPWWWELTPLALALCATAVAGTLKGKP